MKKQFLLLTFLFLVFSSPVFARSGCCSHHQGVCGCGCCDGTSLSDICAPYYPQCSSGAGQQMNTVDISPSDTPIPPPTWTPWPTKIPTRLPTLRPTRRPTVTFTPRSTRKPLPKIKVKRIPSPSPTQSPGLFQWLFGK